jgi:hypothetical protein
MVTLNVGHRERQTMKHLTIDKALRGLVATGVAVLAGLMLLKMASSLDWRMEHDTPLLHYAAFLMDVQDAVPYRDIFETSMPGTFAFHYAVVKLFGYGDFAFHCVDICLLCVLFAATYLFMARFGRLVAFVSTITFGLVYLGCGQSMTLQRDYIGVIPVAFSLLCVPRRQSTSVGLWRFGTAGLLFGLSVLVKPHLAVALPIVLGSLFVLRQHPRKPILDLVLCTVCCGTGLVAPLAIAMVWLAANAAFTPFTEMLFHYIPLHSAMTGWHENISGLHRVGYLIENTVMLGGYGVLFVGALFGAYIVAERNDIQKPVAMSFLCVLLCALSYAVYPTLAGKFWGYHYMPFAYFCAISTGFCFFSWNSKSSPRGLFRFRGVLPIMAFFAAVTIQLNLPRYVLSLKWDLSSGVEVHAPKGGRVDEIATWLKARLRQDDTVQPLDWTGGALHAMLLSEARLATTFMYDYHFYHHVSRPLIQELRRSFIRQLQTSRPRFVIEVETNKPWVSGLDSNRSFPELKDLLNRHYVVAFRGNGYLIHERKTVEESSSAQQAPRHVPSKAAADGGL